MIMKLKKEKKKIRIQKVTKLKLGHQIRSYVATISTSKDNRTNYENTSPDKVLDGELDDFLEQFYIKLMKGKFIN